MADENARKVAEEQAAKDEKERFAEWKQFWEDEGFTVTGDSLANAVVSELPEGPSYNDKPGA
jgi:hypothetical protein